MTTTNIPLTAALSKDSIAKSSGASVGLARVTVPLAIVLFLNMLPVTMIVLVLKELKQTFNTTTVWTHMFMSINMIAAVLAAPIGAAISDKFGRRKPILLVAMVINATTLFLMALLCQHQPVLWLLFVVRFFEGAAHIITVTTIMALAGDWAPSKNRGRVMGLIGASLMFGTACGSMIGSRLGNFTPVTVFQLGAIIVIGATILTAWLIRESSEKTKSTRMRDTLTLVSRNKSLMIPYAYAFIDRFCVGVIVSTLILYLSEIVGLTPAQRGGMLALFLVPFALLCYPVGRLADRRWGRIVPMCVGSLLFGVVFALYGLIPHSWLYGAMLASGILSAIMFAPNLTMCSDMAPKAQRAAAFAGFNVAGSLGFLCGPLLGVAVFHWLEPGYGTAAAYTYTFVVAGCTEILCALITLPFLLRLHRAKT